MTDDEMVELGLPAEEAAKLSSEEKLARIGMLLVLIEYKKATDAHGSFNSAHEGYAVLLEELDELWDEVKLKEPDRKRLLKEAAQVSAMGLRFMIDVCLRKKG